MSISTNIYSILISNGNTNSSPSDGFVDNLRIEDFGISLKTTPSGLTYNLCKAKRRANMRFREIINQTAMIANCYLVNDPSTFTSDSTIKTEATAFGFQMIAEHGEASLNTEDELNPGTILTGVDCLTRCVARALAADYTLKIDVVDPTSAVSTPATATSVPRYGVRVFPLQMGAYEASLASAEAMITVTDITP